MATTTISSQNLTTFLQPSSSSSLQSARSVIHLSSSLSLRPSPSVSINLAARSRRRSSLVANATSTTAFSPGIGDNIGDVSIFTASGDPVLLKHLWDQNEGVAVIALLRHFGCVCCWELASNLKASKERLESAGVKLIAIGVGAPNKARILAERKWEEHFGTMEKAKYEDHFGTEGLPFPLESLYADPERKAYDVLGLYYGVGRTFFNPASAKVFSRIDALQKAVKNYTIEATPDDISGVLQQGGMFVFKGKELLYAWKDEGTGDHAPMDDIFNLCSKVPNA